MTHLCIADWNSDNYVIAEASASSEDEAAAKVAIMKSEGYSKAFYVEMPERTGAFLLVDPDKKTVSHNTSAYNAHIASLKLADFTQTRNNLLTESDWTLASDTALSDGDKNKWIAYRKLLRDLPETDGFDAADVTWPDAP